MGIYLVIDNLECLILNIYCICDYGTLDSLIEYKLILSELANFIYDERYNDVIIAGDFNSDPKEDRR